MRDAAARALGASRTPRPHTRVAALAAIFLLALAVRSLYALDLAPVMYSRVQPGTRMAWRYDEAAVGILRGEGILWPRDPDPARTGLLARPPGYPLYMALVYGSLGRSFFTAQLVQNVLTSVGCVLLALAAARLAGWGAGVVGGLIAALSPHLAYSSNFVLPDALSALPLLAAVAVLARAHPGPRGPWWTSAMAGALVGAGVWLRPNVLLLAPLLAALVVPGCRDAGVDDRLDVPQRTGDRRGLDRERVARHRSRSRTGASRRPAGRSRGHPDDVDGESHGCHHSCSRCRRRRSGQTTSVRGRPILAGHLRSAS